MWEMAFLRTLKENRNLETRDLGWAVAMLNMAVVLWSLVPKIHGAAAVGHHAGRHTARVNKKIKILPIFKFLFHESPCSEAPVYAEVKTEINRDREIKCRIFINSCQYQVTI